MVHRPRDRAALVKTDLGFIVMELFAVVILAVVLIAGFTGKL